MYCTKTSHLHDIMCVFTSDLFSSDDRDTFLCWQRNIVLQHTTNTWWRNNMWKTKEFSMLKLIYLVNYLCSIRVRSGWVFTDGETAECDVVVARPCLDVSERGGGDRLELVRGLAGVGRGHDGLLLVLQQGHHDDFLMIDRRGRKELIRCFCFCCAN